MYNPIMKIRKINNGKRNLKEWMKEHRYSCITLGKKLNIAHSTVWEWLQKDRRPRLDTLLKFNDLIREEESEPFEAHEFFKVI